MLTQQTTQALEGAMQRCDATSTDVIAYVTKMIAVESACLVNPEAISVAHVSRLRREDVIAKLRERGTALFKTSFELFLSSFRHQCVSI